MLSYERRNAIAEIVHKQGSVDIASLVKDFGVSPETIRKDLILLEKSKRVQRIHGGVIPYSVSASNLSYKARLDHQRKEKRSLSVTACSLIKNGDWIFVDTGSTAAQFASVLAQQFTQLHVVTNSAYVFNRLAYIKGFDVILTGGQFCTEDEGFYGKCTLDALDEFHVDISFISPVSISLKHGAMDFSNVYCDVQRKAMEICTKSVFLADSEKFEKTANYRICPISSISTIVTDSSISQAMYDLYTENGINIIK